KTAAEFENAHTMASGLRVPKAVGDFLMLKILRESDGGAIAVDDEEMIRVTREVGANEGLFICPEGAACFVALKLLRSDRKIASGQRVVIFNTGSIIKYLKAYDRVTGWYPMLRALAGEDGDAFCERFRWLGVETPSDFQRITAQSFAAFGNQFLE